MSFLNATLEAGADLVGSSVAQRALETSFPRLRYCPVVREDWKDGKDAAFLAFVSLLTVGPNRELT